MSKLGHARERQARKLLENDGWWVCRAAGSLGDADLVALKAREFSPPGRIDLICREVEARLVEVKATAGGPYHGFGPADRERLARAARRAGAEAWLLWWPARKKPVWIPEQDWPASG